MDSTRNDFIENREDESLFVIAELYLSELTSRSIVQVQVLDEDVMLGRKCRRCKLHDVVRELCLSMGGKRGLWFTKFRL